MRIITISREFGSGGREIGKKIANALGIDYYDSEIITMLSNKSGLDENYIHNVLNHNDLRNYQFSFGRTFSIINKNSINLLIEQKKIIEEIAKLGKDFVIVGRNADVILQDYNPFNIFICSSLDSKVERCLSRMNDNENLSKKELINKIKNVDKTRIKTRELMTNKVWGQRDNYNLIVNSSNWDIDTLSNILADIIIKWYGGNK